LETFSFRGMTWFTLAGASAMGFVGFICGYLGPVYLNPDANAGPLLGIFITGPLGALIGALVGIGGALARLRLATFAILVAVCASIVAGATLYKALPEDRWDGTIIDASIRECRTPDTLVAGAVAKWDRWNGKSTWRVPRPGWKEDVADMLQRDKGVVLVMFVYRERKVLRQRKPWNRDILHATAWQENGRMEMYFDRSTQGSCAPYPFGRSAFYSAAWEASDVSPSDVVPSFLGLSVLRDVPTTYQEFVQGQTPAS
jgi:hypothetical protein